MTRGPGMNALVDLLNTAWAQRVGWALVHFLWEGAAIAGLLWLVLRLAARRRPQVRYVVSCVALLLMVVAPVVTYMVVPLPPAITYGEPKVTPIFIEGKHEAVGLPVDFGQVPVDLQQLRPEHLRVIDQKYPWKGDWMGACEVQRPFMGRAVELRFREGFDLGSGNGVTV